MIRFFYLSTFNIYIFFQNTIQKQCASYDSQKNIDQIHSTWQLQQDALEDFRKLVCLMVMSIFLFLDKIIPKIFFFCFIRYMYHRIKLLL